MLKLSARVAEKYPHGAIIGIRVNEVQCGVVCAKLGDVDELVALLDAAGELQKVCKGLEAVTFLVTEMLNAHNLACPSALRFLTEQAHAALAKAKGTT